MYDGWKIFVISLVVALVVSVGVCGLFFFIFVPHWQQRTGSVDVPEVTDLTLEDATLILNTRGFLVTVEKVEDPTKPEGQVISQSPPADYRANRGEVVKLRVSSGAPLVEVPSLEGVSIDEAIKFLHLKGLKPGEVKKKHSESVRPNHVISSEPPSGSLIEKASTVNLIVSIEGKNVTVPKLYGRTLAGTKSVLAARSLKLGNVNWTTSEEHPFDIVISQFPKPGTKISENSEVDVTINREAY